MKAITAAGECNMKNFKILHLFLTMSLELFQKQI